LNFRAAARIAFFVSGAIVSATEEPFMTSDTVAGASPRYAANSFKPTVCSFWGPLRTGSESFGLLAMAAVLHKKNRAASNKMARNPDFHNSTSIN
jgi:hypothetical protein